MPTQRIGRYNCWARKTCERIGKPTPGGSWWPAKAAQTGDRDRTASPADLRTQRLKSTVAWKLHCCRVWALRHRRAGVRFRWERSICIVGLWRKDGRRVLRRSRICGKVRFEAEKTSVAGFSDLRLGEIAKRWKTLSRLSTSPSWVAAAVIKADHWSNASSSRNGWIRHD